MPEKMPFASENYATAVAIWREQAAAGDADAHLAMGLVYRRGVGVPKTPAKTVKWPGLAAAQALPQAQSVLGRMFETGDGVKHSICIVRLMLNCSRACCSV